MRKLLALVIVMMMLPAAVFCESMDVAGLTDEELADLYFLVMEELTGRGLLADEQAMDSGLDGTWFIAREIVGNEYRPYPLDSTEYRFSDGQCLASLIGMDYTWLHGRYVRSGNQFIMDLNGITYHAALSGRTMTLLDNEGNGFVLERH